MNIVRFSTETEVKKVWYHANLAFGVGNVGAAGNHVVRNTLSENLHNVRPVEKWDFDAH